MFPVGATTPRVLRQTLGLHRCCLQVGWDALWSTCLALAHSVWSLPVHCLAHHPVHIDYAMCKACSHVCSLMSSAGRVVESSRASVYALVRGGKVEGLMVSSAAAEDDADEE